MRIVRTSRKILYVLAAAFVVLIGSGAFQPLGRLTSDLVLAVLTLVATMVAARSFRGRDERVSPPRPLWRMTSRPLAGFLIGGYLTIATLVPLLYLGGAPDRVDVLIITLTTALLAFLYLNSSIRLTRRRASGGRGRPVKLPNTGATTSDRAY